MLVSPRTLTQPSDAVRLYLVKQGGGGGGGGHVRFAGQDLRGLSMEACILLSALVQAWRRDVLGRGDEDGRTCDQTAVDCVRSRTSLNTETF